MRIAVVGAGGAGGYFGGLLSRAGEEVTLIARGRHLWAIREAGLSVKSRIAGDFIVRPRATDTSQEVGPVDLVMLCVKTYDLESALGHLSHLAGPQTIVMSVQNGIDNEDRIAQMVGSQHVIGATAFVVSATEAPGVIAQSGGPGRIVVGELSGPVTPRIEALAAAFRRAGIAAETRANMRVALWEKFVFICAFSGVTALTRLAIGTILAVPETRTLLQHTMAEVELVARAEGIDLSTDVVENILSFLPKLESDSHGSLYTDLVAGRPLELESLNGTVVRLGERHRIPTPANSAIYAALKPYLRGVPPPP